jgi:DNA processing protein
MLHFLGMRPFGVHELMATAFPPLLREIPQPPTTLNYRGTLPSPTLPLLAVVGSRQYTTYGKQAVNALIDGLRDYRVGIVSGLALGIDSLAHEAALRNNMYTLAIPGSGLQDEVLYPRAHVRLAHRILESNGGLMSEFTPEFKATKWSFIQRNRLMAGITHATLVIEATEQSGTLTTARMCVDYNRELLVVPGNIFSLTSKGPHLFMKLGATPVTCAQDIIDALKLEPVMAGQKAKLGAPPAHLSPIEQTILAALREPTNTTTLLLASGLSATEANVTLMQLELKGLIANDQGIYRRLV